MKIIAAVAAAVILAMFPPHVKDFSGHWRLDIKKSTNLPPSFKDVESYTMDVRQTPDSMIVVVGLAGGGQNVKFPVTNYLFNGAEVFREDTLRMSKRWIKSSWSPDNSALIVTSRVEQGTGDKKKEYTQRDEWKMTGASSFEITIAQTFAHPDSTHNERRVFHKMK